MGVRGEVLAGALDGLVIYMLSIYTFRDLKCDTEMN